MDAKDVEEGIGEKLRERKKDVLNRNAISALFGAFADPVGSLGKIFVGRGDALANEEMRIRQEVVVEMLCRIDDAITQARKEVERNGMKWIELAGRIEAVGIEVEEVTGVRIASDSGPVEFKPGTHVVASGTRARQVTGVRIGEAIPRSEDK